MIAAGFILAYQFVEPAPPKRFVMATGGEAGAYYSFAKRYAKRFAREGIELIARPTAGSVENLSLLSDAGAGVSVAFMQSGIGIPQDHPALSSLGSVYYEPIWVFVRSQGQPRRLTELTGKRIAIGNPGSGTEAVARKILTDNGIQADTAGLVNLGGAKSADALLAGGVDAAMFVTSVTSKPPFPR